MRASLAMLTAVGVLAAGSVTATVGSRPTDDRSVEQTAPVQAAAHRAAEEPGTRARSTVADHSTANPAAGRERPGAVVDRALAQLVRAGTLTAAQADAVRAALRDAMRTQRLHRAGRPHRLEHRMLAGAVREAARVIGIAPGELRAELKTGRSLAEIAARRGVAAEVLVAALVAAGERRISTAVDAGRLTAEQADRRRERLGELAARLVHRQPHHGWNQRGPSRPGSIRRHGRPDVG